MRGGRLTNDDGSSEPRRRTVLAVRRTVLVLALALGAALLPGVALSPGRPAVALPLDRPNIVLILTDDQTFESVDHTFATPGGTRAVMPYVHGRGDWIRFDNAFVNVSLCCPSRASILTGLYSHHTGVEGTASGTVPPTGGDALDDSSTVATWLHDVGYRTALVGKYLNGWPFVSPAAAPPGWDTFKAFHGSAGYCTFDWFNHDTDAPDGPDSVRRVANGCATQPKNYSTDFIATKALNFIDKRFDPITGQRVQPFFLAIAPNAPHSPRTPAVRDNKDFANLAMPRSANFNEGAANPQDIKDKPNWVQNLPALNEHGTCPYQPPAAPYPPYPSYPTCQMDKNRRAEYQTLGAVDDLVKSVFDRLQDHNALDNTIVVFMTDNGYSFGEHRYQRKRCPYEECIRTPLLVRYPGQGARNVDKLIQNVDLAPTFAELARVPTQPAVHPAARPPTDGVSIVPLLEKQGDVNWRTSLLLRWKGGRGMEDSNDEPVANDYDVPEFWGIRTDRYKYIEYPNVTAGINRELYDLEVDPAELANLANQPGFAEIQTDLARQLAVLRSADPSH